MGRGRSYHSSRSGTGTAACYTPCTGECDTEGATQCSTDMVQSCVMEADGCLYWSDVLDCSVTGYYCDDSLGDAYCIRPCEFHIRTGSVKVCIIGHKFTGSA